MEERKLVSMCDIQEELEDYVLESKNYERAFKLASLYREFIKQPLKLGQFVPCDLEDNVLKEPVEYNDFLMQGDRFVTLKSIKIECEQYLQAKERVLFEGCTIKNIKARGENYFIVRDISNKILWVLWNKSKSIENLINSNLTLTESAIKQIEG